MWVFILFVNIVDPAPLRPAPPPPPEHSAPEEPAEEAEPDTVTEPAAPASPEKQQQGGSLPYDPEVVEKLEERRGQYRQAAVQSKRAGNKQDALKFAQIVKVSPGYVHDMLLLLVIGICIE